MTNVNRLSGAFARHWAPWAALAVALVWRLARVGLREAWLDEACTSLFAQLPSPGLLLDQLIPESHPPLYYLFMWLWVRLFGAGELALRFPSLLAGLALVWLSWRAVHAFGGGRLAAALAAFAAALSPLLVHYSVEAKAYTILWSVAVALLLSLRRASTSDGGRAWWAASAWMVVALYLHHYALFLLPLWVLAVLAADAEGRLRGGLALGLSLLAWLPWAAGFLAGQAQAGGTDWLAGWWEGVGPALWGSMRLMALATPFPRYLGELGQIALPAWSAVVVAVVAGLPVLAGLWALLRRPAAPARSLMPLALLLGPTLGAALVSLAQPIYLVGRYELMAYPAWLLLWALGIGWLLRRARGVLRFVAVFVALGAFVPSSLGYLTVPASPWSARDAAAQLAPRPDAEVVVTVGLARAPVEHQLRTLGDLRPLVSFPPDVAQHPGWWRPERYEDADLQTWAAALAQGLAAQPAVWVVVERGTPARVLSALIGALQAEGRRPVHSETFGGYGLLGLR